VRCPVVLWGFSGDATIDAVRGEFARRGEPYVFVDQREYGAIRFELEASEWGGPGGSLECGTGLVDLDTVGAVFVRPLDGREVVRQSRCRLPSAEAGVREVIDIERRLFAWTDVAASLVVNRPSAMASNLSKPLQSEHIRDQGLAVPATLVTTSPADVHEFVAEHSVVICKSVSGQFSITSKLTEDDLDRIDEVVNCPTQFQEHVAGTDWRVHVIGDAVFPCEIRCDADDYRVIDGRNGQLEIIARPLPTPIADRCLALARALRLPLAGIDLRRTSDDQWYCFEVNGAPVFDYYERVAGQPLAAAVADLLLSGRELFA